MMNGAGKIIFEKNYILEGQFFNNDLIEEFEY